MVDYKQQPGIHHRICGVVSSLEAILFYAHRWRRFQFNLSPGHSPFPGAAREGEGMSKPTTDPFKDVCVICGKAKASKRNPNGAREYLIFFPLVDKKKKTNIPLCAKHYTLLSTP